jgi:D-glycero-D-manno-heptose 1,7-bisphosphate phosphatase
MPVMQDRAIFIDLEGVIIEVRPGRERPVFSMRPGAEAGLLRLAQSTDRLIALVEPAPPGADPGRPRPVDQLVGVRAPMTKGGPEVLFVGCPHEGECDCRKPGAGLIRLAAERHRVPLEGGWHISGDADAVVAGRSAGLRTVRIGPPASDPETAVHRADYQARDLLDAANWILVQSLGMPTG